MPQSRRHAERRQALINAGRGAVLLGHTANHAVKIRNLAGKPIPCCWSDCEKDADNRYRVEIPHNQPRWKDPISGKQEMLVYAFCGPAHKTFWVNEARS